MMEAKPVFTPLDTPDIKRHDLTTTEKAEFGKVLGIEQRLKARWKIELHLQGKRSHTRPFPGVLMIFESGKGLNGGGDAVSWWCISVTEPDAVTRGFGCGKIINFDSSNGVTAICPHCQRKWDVEYLTGERLLNLTTQHWAEVLEREFHNLGGDADIYLKYHKTDIRPQALGNGPITSRSDRSYAIYPLANIMRDISAGADVVKRFKAFLEA